MEVVKISNQNLVINEKDWLDQSLYVQIARQGFRNVNWSEVPDEVMLYLFLHDEPAHGRERSNQTKKEYFRDIRDLLAFASEFGGIRYVNQDDIEVYQSRIHEKYKATSLRRKSAVIKQFLRYLNVRGMINQDLSLMMKKVAIKKEDLVNRDLYEHEVKQLLDYFKKKDWFAYTLIFILVSTGLRIAELASANWSSLMYHEKLDRYFLTVIGKRKKERPVVIFNDVLEVVKELRRRKGLTTELNPEDETAFFPKSNGSHYNSSYLSNEFSRLIMSTADVLPLVKQRLKKEEDYEKQGNSIKFRITAHTCRHFTATYYSDQDGIDVKDVRDLLGHESITTTETYLRRKRRLEEHAGVKLGEKFM
ncbi:tyrosine-type recombinase/integrase [Bacillus sp. SCS-151]|uniref:tyrosine-type recombinase/integrase n=1 Tax=Nanhaiella sioensis TaxID=3115293 RepID=UPI00397D321F